jgi:hypothetical protein
MTDRYDNPVRDVLLTFMGIALFVATLLVEWAQLHR